MLLTEKMWKEREKFKKMEGFIQNQSKKARYERQSETIISPERLVIHKGLLSGLK